MELWNSFHFEMKNGLFHNKEQLFSLQQNQEFSNRLFLFFEQQPVLTTFIYFPSFQICSSKQLISQLLFCFVSCYLACFNKYKVKRILVFFKALAEVYNNVIHANLRQVLQSPQYLLLNKQLYFAANANLFILALLYETPPCCWRLLSRAFPELNLGKIMIDDDSRRNYFRK